MSIKELLRAQRLFFFCLAVWNPLTALPSGGEAIQGHATFISSSEALQINANGKAILNWEQFNIASHESVRFVQSQETQAILNRVTSGTASEILGSLQANCPIYLVNPNGVFIGSSACIETAGFLASTADLSNEAFWQGAELLFQEFGNGRIVNLGKIHADQGDVFLVARAGIDNQGGIEAPNGIAMLTTREMMLYPDSKKCVFIRVSDAAEEGVQNSGTIQALAVELQTQSPYEKAIQHSGSIEAFATLEQNGRIYLISEGGTVVNGLLTTKSGEVRVLGQTVVLEDGAVIDLSGEFGGGTALIGGDYQGANSEILNALEIYVEKGAQIQADAVLDGDGGKVILWADEKTSFWGTVSAEGGKSGGNGGFVEISAKSNDWHYGGTVSTKAPFGKSGTLLLDPSDITISAGAMGGSSPAFSNPYNPVTATATLTNGDLQNALTSSNVTVATSNGAGGSGIVTFNADVTWNANTQLTVNATRNILVNAGVTISNTFTGTPTNVINFTANTGSPIAANFSGITITGTISAIDGNISCTGTGGTSAANEGIAFAGSGQVSSSGNGSISLIGTGSSVGTAGNKEGIRLLGSSSVEVQDGNLYMEGNGGTGGASQGIELNDTCAIRSRGAGKITLKGVGLSTDPTNAEVGIILAVSAVVESLGMGDIDITATGGGAGAGGHGLSVTAGTHISSVSGTIKIVGQGSPTSANTASGVSNSAEITTQSGLIDITATGGGVGNPGTGLDMVASTSLISSTSGNITIVGKGSPNATTNGHGVRLVNGQITTQSGAIDITATGGGATGTGGAPGFGMANSTARVQATTTGSIIIRGTGGGSASTNVANYGMSIQNQAQILTITGDLTCECSGGSFGTNAWGVNLSAVNSKIGSTGGTVTITGTGGGAAASNHGIYLLSGSQITNTTGPIILNGTAAPLGTVNSSGIFVTGSPSAITTTSGNIEITAQGNGNGNGNNGLSVTAGGVISTASGTISGNATASTTAAGSASPGIFINGLGSRITTATGIIDLTGTGGSISTAGSSQGIRIASAGSITTTSTATSITLSGLSTAPNEGIIVRDASSTISSSTGTISLTGTVSGGDSDCIAIGPNSTVVTNTSGTITANGNQPLLITNNSSIRTLGTGGPGLNDITVTSPGVSLTAGTSGQALISTANGNITITSTDEVALTASTVASSLAQITVGNVANTLALYCEGLTLTGGSGSGAFAEISTVGGLITVDGVGDVILTGGTSTTSPARIITRTNIPAGDAIRIGSTTPPTTLTLQGGVAAGGATALIASNVGGHIVCNTSGTWTIAGGSATNDARAGIVTGLASGTGNITATGGDISITGGSGASPGFNYAGLFTGLASGSGNIDVTATSISLMGGSSSGTNYARIATPAGGGSITLNTSGGPNELRGGSGVNTAAQILASGTGAIGFTAGGDLSLRGSLAGGGTNALASISTMNGNITLSASGLLTMTGGTQTGTLSRITVGNSANTVSITSNGLTMSGNSGSGAFAEISTVGGLITVDGVGDVMLTGGTSTTSPAQIITRTNIPVGDAIRIGSIMPPTTLTLQGGLAAGGAAALIASNVGGHIVCNTSGDWTIAGGSSTNDARAGIVTGLASGTGNITATGGAISITGGSGASPGFNYAGLFTGLASGSGNIDVTATSISLMGGSSSGTNYARIATPAGGGSITLNTSGGPNELRGGTGNVADAQVITNGIGNIHFIGISDFSALGGSGASSFADVNAKGTLTIDMGTGNYILTGDAGDSSFARFTATGAVGLTGGDYTLTGGASGVANGSNAVIESTGINGSVTLVGNDIALNGGSAADQHSYIQTAAGSGANPITIACDALNLNGSSEVQTVLGDIDITASGDITLIAGAAPLAAALIESTNQGALTLNAQNFIVEAGSTAGSSGIITQSGDISITCTQDASLSATVPNALAALQTFGSDLTMSVGGSINLVGASISTSAPVGNLLLIAGVDITIDGTTEVTALGTMASSFTLVVDNNFPTPPGIGPGAFILDAGGILSTEPGMPLKIYTAVRDQNSVNSPINGVPFVPGTLGVNTSTEEWEAYYPGGSYEGAAFKFYYKTMEILPPSPSPVNSRQFFDLIAANLVELAYLLPILDVSRKHYHSFSPYGSFIFEDDVYWVGTGF